MIPQFPPSPLTRTSRNANLNLNVFPMQTGRLVVLAAIDSLTVGQRFKQSNDSVILQGGDSEKSLYAGSKLLSNSVRTGAFGSTQSRRLKYQ